MKQSATAFLLASFVVVASLGMFQCEHSATAEIAQQNQLGEAASVSELVARDVVAKQRQNKPEQEEDFPYQFPNIFDVFRSIF